MSAAHTPGPWFTSSRSDGGIGPKSKDEDQYFDIVIPVAYIEAFDWPGIFTHNARLIAAAPDLLAVVEAMAFELNLHLSAGNSSPFSSDTTLRTRAAIAKATGETK